MKQLQQPPRKTALPDGWSIVSGGKHETSESPHNAKRSETLTDRQVRGVSASTPLGESIPSPTPRMVRPARRLYFRHLNQAFLTP